MVGTKDTILPFSITLTRQGLRLGWIMRTFIGTSIPVMRITLLSAALLFSLHTCFAAVPLSQPLLQPADSTAKLPTQNTIHDKKKGTLGFISGLLLGPVGLGGVYLFTHNHAQRKAAKKGCVIFATVVVVAALCWLIVLGAKSGASPSSGSSSRSGGSSGSSGSGRSGGSGSSSGGARGSGGSHSSSNSDWGNNINWPSGSSSPSTKKKPDQAQPSADWSSMMSLMH